jgi:hypothetical protein
MRDAVLLSLNRIAMGGIFDHLGGGFARYSTDERWLVPHFEKMLYDNAQLLSLIADAWCVTRDPLLEVRAAETVGWLEREMAVDGLFAASLDADSEGEEGRFYVWSKPQVEAVLGADAGRFAATYDVTERGNWEGVNVLNRLGDTALADGETERFLADCRGRLLEAREQRPRPARDDKLLADWNGLLIAALARAGAAFARPDWIDRAADAFATARERFGQGDRLIHAVRGNARVDQGFALDYAAMIHAALALHAARSDMAPLENAIRWTATLERHHVADHGGYYWTADDVPPLVVRPDSPADEAVPNANGLMVENAATLWALTGDRQFEEIAGRVLSAHARAAAGNVFSCASLLNGMDQLHNLATVTAPAAPQLLAATQRSGHPAAVPLVHPPEGHPAAGTVPDGAAVLCRRGTCSLPVSDPQAFVAALWQPK